MAKPTDGPWTYESTNAGHFWVLPAEGARAVIAEVYDEANARLIAKARHLPELTEALRKAAHELNAIRARDGAPQHIDWYRGRPMQSNGVSPEYFNELVDECHAALALVQETE